MTKSIELKEFTKTKIQEEIIKIGKKVSKLENDIKNHNEILKKNKEEKEECEKMLVQFKTLLTQL
jgi:hypothetical protein